MLQCEAHAIEVRNRLRNPPRPIIDRGIALQHPVGVKGPSGRNIKPVVKPKAPAPIRDWLWPPQSENNLRANRLPPNIIPHIKSIVAREFLLSVNDIEAHRRIKHHVIPRHVAIYLCKTITLLSYPAIGRKFSGRDHTTIMHAVNKMDGKMHADAGICQRVVDLEAKLMQDIARWRLGV